MLTKEQAEWLRQKLNMNIDREHGYCQQFEGGEADKGWAPIPDVVMDECLRECPDV